MIRSEAEYILQRNLTYSEPKQKPKLSYILSVTAYYLQSYRTYRVRIRLSKLISLEITRMSKVKFGRENTQEHRENRVSRELPKIIFSTVKSASNMDAI